MRLSTMHPVWKKTQILTQGLLFVAASLFWVSAAWDAGREVMPEAIYGDAVALFEAETWARIILFASFIYLFGIYRNGRSRFSPFIRLAGAISHCALFSAFIYHASTAQYGDVVMIFCGAYFLPMHLWFTALNILDCINVVRAHR